MPSENTKMPGQAFLVNCEMPEMRIAELRNGKLFDFDIERISHEVGNIYAGRIANQVAGMDAAFVDIGQKKNGLLHWKDIHIESLTVNSAGSTVPRGHLGLNAGHPLLVQIARPATGNKGPRLTTRISTPGRYLVLVSPWDTVGVSRRIESETERNRLRVIAEKLRPLDFGVIVRTEAEGATEHELEHDLIGLKQQFAHINESFQRASKPALLHQDLGILGRLVRDRLHSSDSVVWIDNLKQYAACSELTQSLVPELASCIKCYDQPKPIFEFFNVDRPLKKALEKSVSLPHGGSLIIEETEALTAIDVNTGRYIGKERLTETVLLTNLEAVQEAALQIRLRSLGGVIVIDFIDMERTRDRVQVLDALDAALKLDRVKTHIVQLSPSGLVEITRRREGLSLQKLVYSLCQTCHGNGFLKSAETVGIDLRRRLRYLAKQPTAAACFMVRIHPLVALALIGTDGQLLEDLEADSNAKHVIRVDTALDVESFQIEPTSPETLYPKSVNIRFTLGPNDLLIPEEQPEFAVWQDVLVKLPATLNLRESSPYLSEVVVLEIVQIAKWFATARIVRDLP